MVAKIATGEIEDFKSEKNPHAVALGKSGGAKGGKARAASLSAEGSRISRGDVWTWTALDADSKLIISWMVGDRDAEAASLFIGDLKNRLANRVQLRTDGHHAYLDAVEDAFGGDVDYAMLVKLYGASVEGKAGSPRESDWHAL